MGRIFYLMGKSACGKDTLYRAILKKVPGLRTYTMYTTRPRREGEINGEAYFFTDEGTVEEFRRSGRLIECRVYDTVRGPWIYATADDGQIDLEKSDYLAVGTLESYLSLRRYFGDRRMVPLYVEVDDGERLMRAVRREQLEERPDYMELCRRFLADGKDFSDEKLEEAGITRRFVNDSFEKCLDEMIGAVFQ